MNGLPTLISDLALILVLAGIVTIIFKRLNQPLVLGYIVAGFICGPHFSFTPSVSDPASIKTWADIGVIFLMFTLGLEFSFKKILKMGSSPFIAACTIIFCMIGIGSIAGHAFGWSKMNSLFLGGMLAMSSTTIIFKALEDLGYLQKKFAPMVLSVLVIEDILGLLLMVVLAMLACSCGLVPGRRICHSHFFAAQPPLDFPRNTACRVARLVFFDGSAGIKDELQCCIRGFHDGEYTGRNNRSRAD